jgi:formylglycine-generating enzyme required for sulfatase activity
MTRRQLTLPIRCPDQRSKLPNARRLARCKVATMSGEPEAPADLAVSDAPPLILLRIPSGRYLMGSSSGLPFAPEGPEHMVEVKEFWMADSLVAGRQFEAVMGRNPSQFSGHPDLPVENVSWLDAREFCERLKP